MKSFLWLVIVALFACFQPIDAQAMDHIRVRGGLSTISGFIGLEYQKNKIAIDVGWMGTNDPGIDSGVKLDPPQMLNIGIRYFHSPDSINGWFGGLSLAGNNQVLVTEDFDSITVEGFPSLLLTVGYRRLFSERLDLTVGGGYGPALGLSDAGKEAGLDDFRPSIDLTLGFALR